MTVLAGIEDVKRVLKESKHIAVLGAHPKETKAAHYVPRYLKLNEYEIYPVNPVYKDEVLFNRKTVSSLAELKHPIDVVEIFRRSEHLESHISEILAMTPLPKVVWFQLGIRNEKVANQLSDAGIDVIQDRCMLADHQYHL